MDSIEENKPSLNAVDPSPLLNGAENSVSTSGSQQLPRSLMSRGENSSYPSNDSDPSYISKDEPNGLKKVTVPSRTSSVDIHDFAATKTDDYSDVKQKLSKETVKFRVFLVIGFLTTTILGVDVATNRYLQINAKMDGIMIITLRSAIAFLVWVPFTKQFAREVFCMKYFFWFAFLHTLNPVLNTYATKYTLAFYVQALKLSSPFWVALMCVFLKDTIPKYTIPAMLISTIGAFLTITGDALERGKIEISTQDLIGMALALSAAICFSMNFVLYTKIKGSVPSLGLTFLENFLQFVVIGSISFGLDKHDWVNIWGTMSSTDYGVLVLAMLDSVLGSFGKIASVRVIGAPLFSTLAPWELVVTLILSASPFLGDPVGPLNYVGVAIITVTMTIYLYLKYRAKTLEGPSEKVDELGFGDDEEEPTQGVTKPSVSLMSPRIITVDV